VDRYITLQKATPFFNGAASTIGSLDFAAERNPDKFGAQTLNSEIPIISEKESRALKPDYYLVLPWHFADEFLERERETILNGTAMIFPLPQIKIIDKASLSKSV